MKRITLLSVSFMMMLAAFTFSCKQQEATPNAPVNNNGISQEVINQFKDLGIDARNGVYTTQTNPLTGKTQKGYSLEKDVFVSEDQFKEMLASPTTEGANGEQYRTSNLVNAPRTIRVLGYTANNSNGLGSTLREALRQAIDRYNAENLSLRFTLAFGSNFQVYDIVVYQVSNGSIGASAGFPTNGNPYKWVRMNSGVNNGGIQLARHITMHELGHCIGFRHTDWFNRSISCGSGGNEGTAGVGAIHIPGTPVAPSFDNKSIMLSCGGLGTPGAFSAGDRTALNYLY
ncbi:M57 family metalloprotease [uncultured Microscilla sp.]|uniref:M57 family metalloprotease n=1 Tax=uncultured Microscilla sp. TaxID=432653 RepID=UPI00262C241B|nr:M57 family metalloprotease [uncultured Microscilla sp.]